MAYSGASVRQFVVFYSPHARDSLEKVPALDKNVNNAWEEYQPWLATLRNACVLFGNTDPG